MAHQPVGDSQTLTTGTGSTRVQFTVQSDTVRVVPISQNVHVAIGTTATATTSDYFVPAGTSATLNLGRASSIGIIYQNYNLLPDFTALENVSFAGLA